MSVNLGPACVIADHAGAARQTVSTSPGAADARSSKVMIVGGVTAAADDNWIKSQGHITRDHSH